jgi:hypothetical protein
MSGTLRRLIASFALAAFVGTLALPFVSRTHLSWDDDADCGPSILAPRHAGTALAPPDSDAPVGHCALCHWWRAFAGAALAPSRSAVPAFDSGCLITARFAWWHGRLTALDRPSRAPPASPNL